jgi:hypothetical protein
MATTVASMINERAGAASDTDLAVIFNVHQSTVTDWRNGVRWPGPTNQAAVATWLGIPAGELRSMIRREKQLRATGAEDLEGVREMSEVLALVTVRVDRLEQRVVRLEQQAGPPAPAAAPPTAPSARRARPRK